MTFTDFHMSRQKVPKFDFQNPDMYILLQQEQRDFALLSGSCQLDRASNVEIGVECQIFVIVISLTAYEFDIVGHI